MTLLKLVCFLTLKLDRRDSSGWKTPARLYPSSQPPESERKQTEFDPEFCPTDSILSHDDPRSFVYFICIHERVTYYMFTRHTYHGHVMEEVHAWLVGFGVGQFE